MFKGLKISRSWVAKCDMKRRTGSRKDIGDIEIPDDCEKIILTQNSSRIVITNKKLNDESRQSLLLIRLKDFFNVPENWKKLKPVLQQNSRVSLRLLDWLVTNYAKKQNLQPVEVLAAIRDWKDNF